MAGLLSGQFGENPFYQGFDARRNSLANFGLGLMQGKTPQEGLTAAVGGAIAGRQQDDAYAKVRKEEEERLSAINETAAWLQTKAQTDPAAADFAALIDAGTMTPYQAVTGYFAQQPKPEGATQDWSRLSDGTLYNQRTGETKAVAGADGAGGGEYGLTPIWGKRPDGTYGYGVQGKDGSFKPVDTGEMEMLDPYRLAGEKAAGGAYGKAQGAGEYSLPETIAKGEQAVQQLQALLPEDAAGNPVPNAGFDEEFGSTFMIPNSRMPVMDRTPRADFHARMDQVQGQAFLQGIQQMAGTGAISEAEGSKATAAIVRASTAQTKEGFTASIKEAISIVNAGLERARQKAAAGPSGNGSAPAAGGVVDAADYFK